MRFARPVIFAATVLIVLVTLNGVFAQQPFEIQVYIDAQSLTLYIPPSGLVSLDSFAYQVMINGVAQTHTFHEYGAFAIPLETVQTPICFQLKHIQGITPLPNVCQQVTVITNYLNPADVFWYDSVALTTRSLIVMQGSAQLAYCGSGNPWCAIVYAPPTYTPTYTATFTATQPPTATQTYTFTPAPTVSAPTTQITPSGLVMLTPAWAHITFGIPSGWGVVDRSTDHVWVAAANTQNLLSSFLASAAVFSTGDQVIQVIVGSASIMTVNPNLTTIRAMRDQEVHTVEASPYQTYQWQSLEVAGKAVEQIIVNYSDYSRIVYFFELSNGCFVQLTGWANTQQLYSLTTLLEDIIGSLQML